MRALMEKKTTINHIINAETKGKQAAAAQNSSCIHLLLLLLLNEKIMVACCQKLRGHRTVSKVRASVLRTRNCQTRPKLSYRIASSEQFSLQVPLEHCQRWWRGHRGRQAVPHPSRRHRKSAVADGGEAGEGYGERIRGRRAETPTSVQIGDAMKVTGW